MYCSTSYYKLAILKSDHYKWNGFIVHRKSRFYKFLNKSKLLLFCNIECFAETFELIMLENVSSLSLKLPKAEKKYTFFQLKNLHTGDHSHSWNCADNITYTTALYHCALPLHYSSEVYYCAHILKQILFYYKYILRHNNVRAVRWWGWPTFVKSNGPEGLIANYCKTLHYVVLKTS